MVAAAAREGLLPAGAVVAVLAASGGSFFFLFVFLFLQRPGPLGGSVAVSVAGWSAGKGGRLVGWLAG